MHDYVPKLVDDSPKLIAQLEIINQLNALQDKMLIFSQSLYTLEVIEKCLESRLNWKINEQYYSECITQTLKPEDTIPYEKLTALLGPRINTTQMKRLRKFWY